MPGMSVTANISNGWHLRDFGASSCRHLCAGMVLTLVLLRGLPTQHAAAAFASYMAVSIANGLLNSWPAPACTNPVFSGEHSKSCSCLQDTSGPVHQQRNRAWAMGVLC